MKTRIRYRKIGKYSKRKYRQNTKRKYRKIRNKTRRGGVSFMGYNINSANIRNIETYIKNELMQKMRNVLHNRMASIAPSKCIVAYDAKKYNTPLTITFNYNDKSDYNVISFMLLHTNMPIEKALIYNNQDLIKYFGEPQLDYNLTNSKDISNEIFKFEKKQILLLPSFFGNDLTKMHGGAHDTESETSFSRSTSSESGSSLENDSEWMDETFLSKNINDFGFLSHRIFKKTLNNVNKTLFVLEMLKRSKLQPNSRLGSYYQKIFGLTVSPITLFDQSVQNKLCVLYASNDFKHFDKLNMTDNTNNYFMDIFSSGYEIINYYLLKGENGTDHALLYETIKFESNLASFTNFHMEHKIFWLDLPQNPANKILKVFANNILNKYDPSLRNDYTILSCIPPTYPEIKVLKKIPIDFWTETIIIPKLSKLKLSYVDLNKLWNETKNQAKTILITSMDDFYRKFEEIERTSQHFATVGLFEFFYFMINSIAEESRREIYNKLGIQTDIDLIYPLLHLNKNSENPTSYMGSSLNDISEVYKILENTPIEMLNNVSLFQYIDNLIKILEQNNQNNIYYFLSYLLLTFIAPQCYDSCNHSLLSVYKKDNNRTKKDIDATCNDVDDPSIKQTIITITESPKIIAKIKKTKKILTQNVFDIMDPNKYNGLCESVAYTNMTNIETALSITLSNTHE